MRGIRYRERAEDGPKRAIKRELAGKKFAFWIKFRLLGGEEESQRERKIKNRALFLERGGGKREHYLFVASLRRFEFARILYCGRDPILRLLDRLIRKSDDSECMKSFHDVALDRDDRRLREHWLCAKDARKTRRYLLLLHHCRLLYYACSMQFAAAGFASRRSMSIGF